MVFKKFFIQQELRGLVYKEFRLGKDGYINFFSKDSCGVEYKIDSANFESAASDIYFTVRHPRLI